jgi:probable F420-dependent oxidoreductase
VSTGFTGAAKYQFVRIADVRALCEHEDVTPISLGVVLATPGDGDPPPDLSRCAQAAERAGADSLWVDDHLAQVEGARSSYPYARDGEPTWPVVQPRWESLTALAFVAAATERCRVGTAVLILPQRHVVELAKTTATLDVLSGGRLVLGCGVGWLAEEMEACGWDFATRGARADELLDALRACWTGRPGRYDGDHVTLPDGLVLEPTPVQRPGPPLLVGGMSRPALRRAAQRGDGWLAFAPEELLDAGELRDQLATLDRLRAEGPRAGEPFQRSLLVGMWPPAVDELIARLLELAALGFDELIVEPSWDDVDATAHAIAGIRAALDGADD